MVAAVQDKQVAGRLTVNRYRIGVGVALASVVMLFTSLTSAFVVRAASANDWRPLPMPRVLLLSTFLIIASSVTLEVSRRRIKRAQTSHLLWLLLTAVLGAGFLTTQLLAWSQLRAAGIYISSNPYSSFYYLLTALHAIHLAGGLLALIYLVWRFRQPAVSLPASLRTGLSDATTIYWHFMGALWLYLFLLLFYWR